jgi:ElaA protein
VTVQWRDRAFGELTPAELHDIYALRVRVFVVEQACAYQEVDGLDPADYPHSSLPTTARERGW